MPLPVCNSAPDTDVAGRLSARPQPMAFRLEEIDAGRAICAVAIILLHTTTITNWPPDFGIRGAGLVGQLMRFAVPFFFITSGFLLARQKRVPAVQRMIAILKRVVPVFLVWSSLYLLCFKSGLGQAQSAGQFAHWLGAFIFAGDFSADHLWFLPAIALCMCLMILMSRAKLEAGQMLGLSLALYLVGLCLGSYREAVLPSIHSTLLNGRNGPFALIFVVMGFLISRANWRPSLAVALIIFIAGAVGHVVESALLDRAGVAPFASNNMLVSTLFFGLGSFLLALHLPKHAAVAVLARAGRVTLGVYVLHILFLKLVTNVLPLDTDVEIAACVASVSLLSFLTATALSKIPPLRALVT